MSERDDSVYLHDILASINTIEKYINDVSVHEFADNQMLQDAVTRRFEIIGEAASHISQGFKSNYPNIEWRLMSDMRNKLIHEYFGISASTIFQTIQTSLPDLKAKILAIK